MTKQHHNDPRLFIDTKELAERLGLARITVETWRARGYGPPYHKIGRLVRYSISEVETWLSQQSMVPRAPRKAGR